MAGQVTEWITIGDFSPGIHGDYHGAGGIASPGNTTRGAITRDGAATIEHTYGCHADQSGALIPLPKRVAGTTQTLLPEGNARTAPAYYPTAHDDAYLSDAVVMARTEQSGSGEGLHVYAMYQFLYSPSGAGANYNWYLLGRLYRSGMSTNTPFDYMWDSSEPEVAVALAAGTLRLHPVTMGVQFATHAVGYPIPFDEVYPGVFFGFDKPTTTAHGSAGIIAGELPLTTFDTQVSANYPMGTGALIGAMLRFPKPDTLAGVALNGLFAGANNTTIFGDVSLSVEHQGRIVAVNDAFASVAASGFLRFPRIGYTPPYDFAGLSGATNLHGAVVAERSGLVGCGAMASLTADELLLVGHRGGAMLIRGDIANPTIVQLPFVESTYGVTAHAVATPIGVVYGSRNGIFAWSGGDTSTKLSQQIDGFFWDHAGSAVTYKSTRGRFGFWHPFVCAPNNYLFDTERQAWWRLCDPATNGSTPYNVYQTSAQSGALYAFPWRLTASQNQVWDTFSADVLAPSYSWRSQPLVSSRDRVISVQEVELVVANPTGSDSTVIVTLEGLAEDGTLVATRTVQFTVPSSALGRPQIIRQSVIGNAVEQGAFTARYIQLRVQAVNDTVAPKIISLGIGVANRSRVREN